MGMPVTDMTLVSVTLPAPDSAVVGRAATTSAATLAAASAPAAPLASMPPPSAVASPPVTPPPSTPSRETLPGVPSGPGSGDGGRKRKGPLIAVGVLAVVALVGGGVVLFAGGGDDPQPPDDSVVVPAAAIASLADAELGTVRIVAEGEFVLPDVAIDVDVAGEGSAFIIDSTGLAVTNNHVVAGAATLEVFVPGDAEPKNARVLGRSECDDLALIDVAGDGYSFFEWSAAEVAPGDAVHSGGYAAGDTAFVLNDGTVTSIAALATTWSATDEVINHDADTQPGQSGGPLLDDDGLVVGVSYAANVTNDDRFAVAATSAEGIVALLESGDVDSVGVNGLAVPESDTNAAGVWVASVETATAAERAGLRPGDVISELNGVDVAADGTMEPYCDVLRTEGADAVLPMTVVRDGELLFGELNGTPLPDAGVPPDDTSVDTEFQTITDETGALTVEVPVDWVTIPVPGSEQIGPAVAASADGTDFTAGFTTAGMFYIATRNEVPDIDALFPVFTREGCTAEDIGDYDDGVFVGRFQTFSQCAGTDTFYTVIIAKPAEGDYTTIVEVQVVTPEDEVALEQIERTFNADSDLF